MDNKVIVRLAHGYFNGGVETLPEECPTIDAHIGCWHILIGEKMNFNRFFTNYIFISIKFSAQLNTSIYFRHS